MGSWQQPHDHINGLDHPAQDPDRFNREHYLSTLTRHADGQRSFFDFFNPNEQWTHSDRPQKIPTVIK